MDFKNGKELLALCVADEKKISKVMVERESFLGRFRGNAELDLQDEPEKNDEEDTEPI